MSVKTKICGLTNIDDACFARDSGADLLGFVMGGSVLPQEIEPQAQRVREIIKDLNSNGRPVESCLVTHLGSAEEIIALSSYIGCSVIQISEYVSLNELEELREKSDLRLIKTIVTTDTDHLERMRETAPHVDMFLADSRKLGYIGGTGSVNDWEAVRRLVREAPLPVWAAGGLAPDNVRDVISETGAYGADVSTGVSRYSSLFPRKDIKDHQKIAAFIKNARGVIR